MNDRIEQLLEQMRALEEELQVSVREQEALFRYRIRGKRIEFENEVRAAHARLRVGLLKWLRGVPPRHLVSMPFIYGMFIPLLVFDGFLSLYHSACFRLYRIPLVRRQDYIVVDRHHLAYLNVIEKLNCIYCGYANGLFAYAREIGARTEQYWCPIKHARKVRGTHARYARFIAFGDSDAYPDRLEAMRRGLADEAPVGKGGGK